ncbi:hypothetical protein M501DRAFT_1000832 [Patellaria atrata CBS 101060]|uniref:Secreted protein n=1 Tax=Patellaria atrata CBS 101060 TaxID=1346257 RepID=A0A9P4SF75_9PEZI|nr:hypothetical protein M501DRAFT_1000832 [Patellaria atrata CBS 101060]
MILLTLTSILIASTEATCSEFAFGGENGTATDASRLASVESPMLPSWAVLTRFAGDSPSEPEGDLCFLQELSSYLRPTTHTSCTNTVLLFPCTSRKQLVSSSSMC